MKLLVLRGTPVFPALCFNCAEPARRSLPIHISNLDPGEAIKRSFISRFVLFGNLFMAFEAAKNDISMILRLPVCDTCRKKRIKPEVQSYDLESREVRVVVHEQFRDAVAAKTADRS